MAVTAAAGGGHIGIQGAPRAAPEAVPGGAAGALRGRGVRITTRGARIGQPRGVLNSRPARGLSEARTGIIVMESAPLHMSGAGHHMYTSGTAWMQNRSVKYPLHRR